MRFKSAISAAFGRIGAAGLVEACRNIDAIALAAVETVAIPLSLELPEFAVVIQFLAKETAGAMAADFKLRFC